MRGPHREILEMPLHNPLVADENQQLNSTGARRQQFDQDQVRGVYHYMYLHTGNREEAEDLTERACLRAMRSAPDAPTRQAMDSLIGQTARAVLVDYLRPFYGSAIEELTNQCVIARPDAPVTRAAEEASATRQAERILAQLPEQDRELLRYRLRDGYSLSETALRMRIHPGDALRLQWAALERAARLVAVESATPGDASTADIGRECACGGAS
jgi:RNA polymerase sigma factor (sigma-70 family)